MLSNVSCATIRRLGTTTVRLSTSRLIWNFGPISRVEIFKDCTAATRCAQYTTSSTHLYAPAATSTIKKSATKPSPASKAKSTKKFGTKKAGKTITKVKKPAKKTTTQAKKQAKKRIQEEQKEKLQAKKEKEEIKKLKETALLSEPKPIADSAWGIVFTEHVKAKATKGSKIDGTPAKEASEKYKSLSANDSEQYNSRANQNKAANVAALKQWVESYTPNQVRLANNARKLLAKRTGKKYPIISDERAPKRPCSAYFFYTADRWAAGDMKGIQLKRIAADSVVMKQIYENKAAADKERYKQEYKKVFKNAVEEQ
ncbi:hypothetical protein F5884DRAFT_812076 [Xylogone sp. PMI_703]|nr:hypothetical protein F5884DRAFT_812076 [Xylogone sp. PMI_703]